MTAAQILIVEDESSLAHILKDYLQHNGYQTHIISEGRSVIDWVKQHQPSLILLDLMLPERDGLDIFRELRTFSDIPVIMVTAKVDEIDRLVGLNMGADDYVCKPYSPREVVARVQNVLRRSSSPIANKPNDKHAFIEINDDQKKIFIDQQQLPVTRAEYQLFQCLYQRTGYVFSRQMLMNSIYSDGRIVSDRTIDSHIKNLRKKIMTINKSYDWIQAVYGEGYRFEINSAQ